MSGTAGRLVKQSGIYAIGNILLKAGGLVIVPIYLNLLSEADYGRFALLDATARVAILLFGLGMATGLLRFLSMSDDPETSERLPFTALVISATAALSGFVILWMLSPWLASTMMNGHGAYPLLMMAAYSAIKIVEAVPLTMMRVQERPVLYAGATILEMLLLIGGVLWLVVGLERGLSGIMEAYVLSAGTAMVVLVGSMLPRIRKKLDMAQVMPLVRFGAPLVLAALAGLFMNIGDRYLLQWLSSTESVGIYDWSARLGGVLNMLFVQSFQLSFSVIGLKVLARAKNPAEMYRRTFRHFSIWAGWAVLGLSVLAYDVTLLLSSRPAYLEAEVLVFPIALGFLLYGLYTVIVNVIVAHGRTRSVAYMVIGSALLNAVLNVAMIPLLGIMGAAVSTSLAYGFLMMWAARVAARHRGIRYPFGRLAMLLGLIILLYLAALPTIDWPTASRLATRLAIILIYPPLLLAVGFYRLDEVKSFFGLIRERLGSGIAAGSETSSR